ncbi:MAG: M14 family zinc carboxypeptidase [Bacteroidota bacterium]
MNKILLFICFLIFSGTLNAQTPEWSRVRIYTGEYGLVRLSQAGICVDHGELKKGYSLTTDLSREEIAKVAALGFTYDVVIADVQAHYINQNDQARLAQTPTQVQSTGCGSAQSFPTPTNFTLGSMGGFFTYAEILWHLDNMATLYPNLVKARMPIDSTLTTTEGRYVYWLKLSDNATTDEPEPEMIYTAAHHAREPAGISQLILYMYYLLENYNSDPEIQYLLNNTELYFVPCVNPDGYIYNETTNPAGGGLWRKNRLDNNDGTFGVDLNRNYGYNWGYDNNGSSPITSDFTYRGVSAFSEAETQLIRQFSNAHQFRIALNYHTYSNLLICPWGYDYQTFTPDSALFASWGALLTADNKYAFGTADQTVGYIVNGSSDDWMYGEQNSKPKIMAMTPEAGDQADGFWPAQNRIIDICKLNIPMDLYAARLLLAYAIAEDRGDRYLRQTSGHLPYDFQRLGLDTTPVYTVSVTPLSPWMTAAGAPRTYNAVSLMQTILDSISYTLNPATPPGTPISYLLSINNGTFTWSDTITKIYGPTTVLLANSGSSITGWNQSGGWNTTTSQFWSAPSCIADSPNNNYPQGANTRLTTATALDLTTAVSAHLSFYTRFEIEPGYDFAQAQVSTDGGGSWTALCGRYTTNNNNLDNGNSLWTGFQSGWVKEQMPLDDYLGQQIIIRFRLISDFGVEYDGFFFDDLLVEVIDTAASSIEEMQTVQLSQNMPNPADGYTYINTGYLQNNGTLEIYNITGQLMMQQPVVAGEPSLRVNTEILSPGVYFYRVVLNGLVSETKRMQVVR